MGPAISVKRDLEIQFDPNRHLRRTPRADAYLCIDICSDHQFWTGLTMNLSEGGVFVATHVTLPRGAPVALHLELPGPVRIMALGEVKWVRAYMGDEDVPPGLGIQFIGLEARAQAAIRHFVTTARAPLLYEG